MRKISTAAKIRGISYSEYICVLTINERKEGVFDGQHITTAGVELVLLLFHTYTLSLAHRYMFSTLTHYFAYFSICG